MRLRLLLSFPFLLLVTAILAVSLLFSLLSLQRESRLQQKELREGALWHTVQINREANQLLYHLATSVFPPGKKEQQHLHEHGDILYSRIDGLGQGKVGEMVLSFSGAVLMRVEAFKLFYALEEELTAYLGGDPDARIRAMVIGSRIIKLFQPLAHEANNFERSNREQTRQRFENLYNKALLFFYASLAAAVLLAMGIWQRQHRLNELALSLEDLVEERTRDLAVEIDQHRITASKLQQLQKLLQDIIDSMPTVLVGIDEKNQVNQWNRAAETISNIPREQALKQNAQLLFEHLGVESTKFSEILAEQQPGGKYRSSLCRGHKVRETQLSCYPLENGGTVVLIEDITEQLRIERLIIQTEKMMSVGGLAAGMAHEINNPLAGILQNVQVIKSRILGEIPANLKAAEELNLNLDLLHRYLELRKVPAMLQAILDSGEQAAKIVENMLNFSRKSEVCLTLHNLDRIIDSAIDLACNDYSLIKSYDFRKIEIIRQFDPALPPVPCDAGQIQQVLFNILKNGAQAMAEGTPDKHHCFTLRLTRNKESVQIDVEDNGPGMEQRTAQRIFEPFFTTKDVGVGTGLGLSVSYFIVTENHHGSMEVNSTPGVGTTFSIRLPLQTEMLEWVI